MRKTKVLISLLLAIILLVSYVPSFAEEESEVMPGRLVEAREVPFMLSPSAVYATSTPAIDDYYATRALAGCPDALRLYNSIVEIFTNMDPQNYQLTLTLPQIVLTGVSNVSLFDSYIMTVLECLWYGRTEFFWNYSNGYDYSVAGSTVLFTLTCYADSIFSSADDIRMCKGLMDNAVKNILKNRPAGQDTYETLCYFNEWLCDHNVYNDAGAAAGTYNLSNVIVSALISENSTTLGPVCQAYAAAFRYLCNKAGIECVSVLGIGHTGPGSYGAHAWNAVKIDGNWYGNDTTWNDSLNDRDSQFCVGSTTSTCPDMAPYGRDQFSLCHVSGLNTGLDNYFPTLSTSKYMPTVRAKGNSAQSGNKVILPFGEYTPANVYNVIENASLLTFRKNGSTISSSSYISTGATATISYSGVNYDTKNIVVRGDMNGDGRITSIDYVMIKNYFSGTNYSGDTAIACDVNGDGNILTSDYFMIKTYFGGVA